MNDPRDTRLRAQLDALPEALTLRLAARGFEAEQLIAWADDMHLGQASRNVLQGEIAAVPLDAMSQLPADDDNERRWATRLGEEAIGRGELAVCVLAGGMATRMGGVVKAMVELIPGFTFLDMVLRERERIKTELGRGPALWLMTSEPTNGPIREALAERGDPHDVATFEQFVSLRLSEDGSLFIGDDGEPSVYATGHGDLPDALRASGLLEAFVSRGGKYVWISNLDNIGARVNPAILGQHIESGAPLTVEVVDKQPGDKGGGPVTLDGTPIIAEHFRLPPSFDVDAVPVFNTNTFIVDARKLLELAMTWTYVEVRKTVKEEGGDRTAVQFERLLGELTMAIPPRIQRVSREGEDSRFIPMKTKQHMADEKDAIARLHARLTA